MDDETKAKLKEKVENYVASCEAYKVELAARKGTISDLKVKKSEIEREVISDMTALQIDRLRAENHNIELRLMPTKRKKPVPKKVWREIMSGFIASKFDMSEQDVGVFVDELLNELAGEEVEETKLRKFALRRKRAVKTDTQNSAELD